jgi:hypothetical protein
LREPRISFLIASSNSGIRVPQGGAGIYACVKADKESALAAEVPDPGSHESKDAPLIARSKSGRPRSKKSWPLAGGLSADCFLVPQVEQAFSPLSDSELISEAGA